MLALTGSQGKTSTKDLLAQVLADAGPTVATVGYFNNELGVPLTVLRADAADPLPGRSRWARAASATSPSSARSRRPTVAPVLNVGTAHLGEFGSREAIAQAKGEIVEALPRRRHRRAERRRPAGRRDGAADRARGCSTFGDARPTSAGAASELDELGRPVLRARVRRRVARRVRLRQAGAHQVANAAAAAAMALAVGVPLGRRRGRRSARARSLSPWRMELHERADGLVVVNDAYNANPASMAAALDALAAIGRRGGRRTVAVLGEMLELGDGAPRSTREVGRARPPSLGVDVVVAVGEPARRHRRRAPTAYAGLGAATSVRTAGREQAADWLRDNVAARRRRPGQGVAGAALEHWPTRPGRRHRPSQHGRAIAEPTTEADTEPMKAILLGGGLALLISRCSAPARRSRCFTQLGLRPGDPRRRPDQPPHQARHADHGRRRHHRLDRRSATSWPS